MKSSTRFLLPLLAAAALLGGACRPSLPSPAAPEVSPTPEPVQTAPLSGVPTLDPTLASLQLAVYPPQARTGLPELDQVIDAVLDHDYPALKGLTRYLELGCVVQDGLGGPPTCAEGESPGTTVSAVPFLGSEGHHQRRSEYEDWQGPDALGLLAAYRNRAGTYDDPAYPAGEFGLVFLLPSGAETLTLQVSGSEIVRYDYGYGGLSAADLESKAQDILLPLSLQPIPTAVPWNQFTDPEGRFSFLYPPPLEIRPGAQPGSWELGGQIRVEVLPPGISWISCFDQALGDCPVVVADQTIQINGQQVRKVSGSIGSGGGDIPQEFQSHVFTLEDGYLVITLYALPSDIEVSDISQSWPLEGMMVDLYSRTVSTVELND